MQSWIWRCLEAFWNIILREKRGFELYWNNMNAIKREVCEGMDKKILHFRNQVSLKAESAYSKLKKYL